MVPENWSMYRVKYIIEAMQLAERYCLTVPMSGLEIGEPGDYLVRYSDGAQRIVQRRVFEGIYTPLDGAHSATRKQVERSNDEHKITAHG